MALAPLLQLVPLPPALWTALPGRASIKAGYEVAGLSLPNLPVSLDPAATWRSFYALLPAIALFLTALQLPHRAFRALLIVAVLVGAFSVLLGLAQLAFPVPWLRPFDNPMYEDAVGFFTGRNNLSALFYSTLPLAMVGTFCLLRRRKRIAALFGAAVAVIIAFGIVLARSRAGFGIGLMTFAGAFAVIVFESELGNRRKVLIRFGIPAAIALLIVLQFTFYRILPRLGLSIAEDLRWPIAATTLRAIAAYFPFGSGFGTFVPVYQMFQQTDTLVPAYINHAHNDWLENLLEGGVLTVLVGVPLVGFLAVSAFRVMFRYPEPADRTERALARTGLLVMLGLLLHEFLEYPLRTQALMGLMAIACAAVMRPLTLRRAEAMDAPPRHEAPPAQPPEPRSNSRSRRRRRSSRPRWRALLGLDR
ncbi:MAG: O-antigen ligase family protein [Xanthobacteraceae bacterium]